MISILARQVPCALIWLPILEEFFFFLQVLNSDVMRCT